MVVGTVSEEYWRLCLECGLLKARECWRVVELVGECQHDPVKDQRSWVVVETVAEEHLLQELPDHMVRATRGVVEMEEEEAQAIQEPIQCQGDQEVLEMVEAEVQ